MQFRRNGEPRVVPRKAPALTWRLVAVGYPHAVIADRDHTSVLLLPVHMVAGGRQRRNSSTLARQVAD